MSKDYYEISQNVSKLHKRIWEIVNHHPMLSNWTWEKEKYFNIDGSKCFFDIYCNNPFRIAIEIQGEQHQKYVKHFHANYSDFKKQVYRDNLKKQWASDNDFVLVKFFSNEKLSDKQIIERIFDELN